VRLPFPERIPFRTFFFFAATLCAVQVLEGTNSTFSLCCFFFILIAGIAFNTAGGLTRASGAYVFFFSILGVILGLCWKAFLGEPADSNLQVPLLTIYLYLAGISMMLVAVYLSRKVTLRHALLGDILPDYKIQTAAIGCTVVGFLIAFIELIAPGGEGTVVSAFNQINHFFPLAIMLGVIHTIRRTGGRRSVNTAVLLSAGIYFYGGLIGFSKEGMLTPIVCYLLAAASQRYSLSKAQIILGILAIVVVFRYLVPYSQYGRNFRQDTQVGNIKVAYTLMTNLGQVRQEYLNSESENYERQLFSYYDSPQGFFDRLQMISMDDALNQHTQQFGTIGTLFLVESIENIVPHFIWKDKPAFLSGNTFAHEIGLLGAEDDSTGVSFSAVSSAYHMAGWMGIFIIAPTLWFILFFVYDSLCGDCRKAPWGLIVLVMFTHAAPEGDLTSVIYFLSTGACGVALASILAAYLMPIVGTLFIGPEGVGLKPRAPVRSIPRRLRPPSVSEIESPAT
jgi:hypothetical protein